VTRAGRGLPVRELLVRELLIRELLIRELLIRELLIRELLIRELLINKDPVGCSRPSFNRVIEEFEEANPHFIEVHS
jgi:hypothetical protein